MKFYLHTPVYKYDFQSKKKPWKKKMKNHPQKKRKKKISITLN